MSSWVWSPDAAAQSGGASQQAYFPDLSVNPLPWGGGGLNHRGRAVTGDGGISFEGNSAEADFFQFINKYEYVMNGGIEWGGEATLPKTWAKQPMPGGDPWSTDPGFGRGF